MNIAVFFLFNAKWISGGFPSFLGKERNEPQRERGRTYNIFFTCSQVFIREKKFGHEGNYKFVEKIDKVISGIMKSFSPFLEISHY